MFTQCFVLESIIPHFFHDMSVIIVTKTKFKNILIYYIEVGTFATCNLNFYLPNYLICNISPITCTIHEITLVLINST